MTAAEAKTKETKKAAGTLHLKYVRSKICTPIKHKRVIQGLGFTRLNQVIEREDTPSIRGMVNKVPHLVEIVAAPAAIRSNSNERSDKEPSS